MRAEIRARRGKRETEKERLLSQSATPPIEVSKGWQWTDGGGWEGVRREEQEGLFINHRSKSVDIRAIFLEKAYRLINQVVILRQ